MSAWPTDTPPQVVEAHRLLAQLPPQEAVDRCREIRRRLETRLTLYGRRWSHGHFEPLPPPETDP